MSDQEKGLIPAVEEIFPKVKHLYCCQHITDNVSVSFKNKCCLFFWQCAKAKTSEAFDKALKELYKVSYTAKEYIENLDYTT